MKKNTFLSTIIISLTLLLSCRDDSIKIDKPTADVYELCRDGDKDGSTVRFHVTALNQCGSVSIKLPGAQVATVVPNDELEEMLNLYLSTNKEIQNALRKLNNITLWSDRNLVIDYNNKIIPDMLTADGTYTKSLKARKTFDKIYIRISEKLSLFIQFPVFGELPMNLALTHTTMPDGRWSIFLNYTALNDIANTYAAAMGLDAESVTLLKSIVTQYKTIGDKLEIGLYLKKIN